MENTKEGTNINPQMLISVQNTVLTSQVHDPWYSENPVREAFVGMTGWYGSEPGTDGSNPALLVSPLPTGAQWESPCKF